MVDRWLRRLTGRPAGPKVFLHIGAMKTGTTFLQGIMSANQSALREAGFLFPGRKWSEQSRAVQDIMFGSSDSRTEAKRSGRWDELRDEMLAFPGKASIISMEFLSFADTEQATRVLESLSGAEVHVVLTVRDATAAIPAQWQTRCRNGGQMTYPRLVRAVSAILNDEPPPGAHAARLFLRTQGIPRMLDVWVPLVGAKRVHVITVPARGTDPVLLWRRFAKVVGVKPSVCSVLPQDSNPSLGHASSELLRQVNTALGERHPLDYDKVIRTGLARQILAPRAHLESPVRLNRRGMNLAARWNGKVREAIAEHGLRVVGSLRDLPVTPPGSEAPEVLPSPSGPELLAAAATAYDGLTAMAARFSTELGDPPPESVTEQPTPPGRWDAAEDPVAAAVADVAALARTCLDLRHRLSAG